MEEDTEPVDWAVYRIDQEIFRRHIPLILQGKYVLKSDAIGFDKVNAYRPFSFAWQYVTAFVLGLSASVDPNQFVGQVGIHEYRLAVEFPKGPELHMELHVKLQGLDIGTGIPVRYYEKWFPDDSCSVTFPDGDLSKIDPHFAIEWTRLFPTCDIMSGAYRCSLTPGTTTMCWVQFYRPFPTIPKVKPALLSRNVPIWVTIPMTVEAKDITRRGFLLCMTIPADVPFHRVVASWEATM